MLHMLRFTEAYKVYTEASIIMLMNKSARQKAIVAKRI